jgi:hypothetical protein
LKKHVHLGWEYCFLQDPNRENISLDLLVKYLEELFQDISRWRVDEQVHSYHLGVERDPVRCPISLYLFLFSHRSHILFTECRLWTTSSPLSLVLKVTGSSADAFRTRVGK